MKGHRLVEGTTPLFLGNISHPFLRPSHIRIHIAGAKICGDGDHKFVK